MKKQQLKTLVTKLSKELFLTLKLIEDTDSISDTDYWLTYKVLNEDLTITFTGGCGVLRVTGQTIGTLTLSKIRELDMQLNKIIRGK